MIHLLLKTTQFIPSEFHHSFFEIDFESLFKQGYRFIITDLDNTLISYDESLPTNEIRQSFTQLKDMGFSIVLLSNNHTNRIDVFCEALDVDGYANAKKPFKSGFQKAFDSMPQADKSKTVIIGDQLMTDIWGANRFGCYSILVNPLKKKTEKWYTKINRKIEQKMIQKIKDNYSKKYNDLKLQERL